MKKKAFLRAPRVRRIPITVHVLPATWGLIQRRAKERSFWHGEVIDEMALVFSKIFRVRS